MERRQEDGLLNNETLILLKIRAWQGRGKGLVIWVFKNIQGEWKEEKRQVLEK